MLIYAARKYIFLKFLKVTITPIKTLSILFIQQLYQVIQIYGNSVEDQKFEAKPSEKLTLTMNI